jgi:hypothetical protein
MKQSVDQVDFFKFKKGQKVRFTKDALQNKAWPRLVMEGIFIIEKVRPQPEHPRYGDQITLNKFPKYWKPSSWLLELAED